MITSILIGGFVSNVAESVVAGLIILGLGFVWVENELRLRERADRDTEADAERGRVREGVLTRVHSELESNAVSLTSALRELPKEDRLLYPLFDVSMWPVVSSSGVFASLRPETTEALLHAYNRMGTIGEQNAFLLDMSQAEPESSSRWPQLSRWTRAL